MSTTIIYVGDEPRSVNEWGSIFKKEGYEVIGLTHGQDWLESIENSSPAKASPLVAVIEDNAIFHAHEQGESFIRLLKDQKVPIITLLTEPALDLPLWADPERVVRFGDYPSVLLGRIERM